MKEHGWIARRWRGAWRQTQAEYLPGVFVVRLLVVVVVAAGAAIGVLRLFFPFVVGG